MSKKIIYGLGLLVVVLIIILFMGKSDKPATSGAPSDNENVGAVKGGAPVTNNAPAAGDKAQGESPIFSWRTSQGMTPAAKPKSLTVFSTGRVVGDDVPGGEKDLGAAFAKTVARRIELEGLMTEVCQTNDMADAGITYTLYSGGQKREIVNPRGDCATSLNVLSGIIDQKLK
jgi:hypothetical protein